VGIEYVNRKGDRYYLQETPAKDGKPRYSFTRKPKGRPVETVPDDHEIYEKPEDAQVFLRRKLVSSILPAEKELVATGIRERAGLEDFIVEIQKEAMVVYLNDMDTDEMDRMVSRLTDVSPSRVVQSFRWMAARSTYGKMMRFELHDAKSRLFCVERWCFLGSIDNWMFLDGPARLETLVDKYTGHLGKESFFDLI
jgi:hypothetical protein